VADRRPGTGCACAERYGARSLRSVEGKVFLGLWLGAGFCTSGSSCLCHVGEHVVQFPSRVREFLALSTLTLRC